ncbi:ferredoxin [Candidatus Woesearchaeota archaeon]|nr:ferredoxin [Candidatus Woesearchaeota archaeon]
MKLEHDRPNCIGCCACAAIAPDFWEMKEDGLSSIKGCKEIKENNKILKEEKELTERDFKINLEAAESCPVNVIHIIKNGKKII